MLNKMFTIYDQKAEAYLPPFFMPTAGMATRTFADCVNQEDHRFNAHPSDYTLFEIGTFDDSTGTIEPETVPKSYGTGVEFIEQPKPLMD